MKKKYLKVLLFSIIVLLCVFGLKSTVFGVEKIEDVEDFNYIPKKEYKFVENDVGEFKFDSNGKKYFYYYMSREQDDVIEIIHKNGTKKMYKYYGGYDDNYSYYDSEGYVLNYKDSKGHYVQPKFSQNQDKEHWKVGTNFATIEFLGIEKKIPVTITESPVKSINYIPKGPYIASDVILDRPY